ncbi:MAG: nitrous oxide reductase accessory protein NosL, partial [Desulfobacterales bacterium]
PLHKRRTMMSDRLTIRPMFRTALCLAGMLTMLLWGTVSARAAGPEPGRKPLDENNRMQISDDDRCPVCGMKVAEHAKFSSAIQLADETTYYFCGTGCMMRAWLHPEIFLATEKEKLQTPLVKDYFTGEEVDGRDVFWVAGSDVIGPMGPALVPVKGEKALEAFKRRHGGKTVFRMDEMNDDKWTAITGRKAAK